MLLPWAGTGAATPAVVPPSPSFCSVARRVCPWDSGHAPPDTFSFAVTVDIVHLPFGSPLYEPSLASHSEFQKRDPWWSLLSGLPP